MRPKFLALMLQTLALEPKEVASVLSSKSGPTSCMICDLLQQLAVNILRKTINHFKTVKNDSVSCSELDNDILQQAVRKVVHLHFVL